MHSQRSILLIGNYPPPFGGVPRHLEDLAPHLVRQGWDVHVLSGGAGPVERRDSLTIHRVPRSRLARLARLPGLFGEALRTGRWEGLRMTQMLAGRAALSFLVRAAVAADIVKRHGIGVVSAYNLFEGAPVGAVLRTLYGLPLVITNFGEALTSKLPPERQARFTRWLCAQASRLTSMTNHCASIYRHLGLAPQITIIPFGVDVQRFSPASDPTPVRQRLNLREADPVVLFVGRMIADMGLHTVLAAAPEWLRRCPELKLVIVGAKGNLTAEATALAQQHPEQVKVASDVPIAELPAYYAAASLLVAPTRGDRACGSLASAEAMATARAVVATRVGGIPEFVDEGETGLLIPPDDPPALTEAVLRLINDADLRRAFGQRGRAVAEARLNRDVTNQRYERLFSELL